MRGALANHTTVRGNTADLKLEDAAVLEGEIQNLAILRFWRRLELDRGRTGRDGHVNLIVRDPEVALPGPDAARAALYPSRLGG
jgi:hypothetical protein